MSVACWQAPTPAEVEETESLEDLYRMYSYGVLYEGNVNIDRVPSIPSILHDTDLTQLPTELQAVHTKMANILQGTGCCYKITPPLPAPKRGYFVTKLLCGITAVG